MRRRLPALLAAALLFMPVAAASQDTPLTSAAGKGDVSTVRALLAKGAAVDGPGPQGATPLMVAAETGRTEVVALLLKSGANVNATRGVGITALHHAAAMDRIAVIDQLLAAGADPNTATKGGFTALLGALRSKAFKAAEHLMDKGATLKATPNGASGLELALTKDENLFEPPLLSEGLARRLLEQGADLTRLGQDGSTILHRAALARQVNLIPLLVAAGVKVDARNNKGQTALQLAVESGTMELLIGGASLFSDLDSRTVRVRLLANGTIGHSAEEVRRAIGEVMQRRRDTVAALLAAGADPRTRDDESATPLHDLATQGDARSIKVLLNAGADPNVVRKEGFSPLMLAAFNAHPEAVRVLVAGGADLELRNSIGETALMRGSAGGGDAETVATLLALGAKVNTVNDQGQSPLLYALGSRSNVLLDRAMNNPQVASVVERLLAAGADPRVRDKDGKDPMDLVKTPKYAAARKLIEKARKAAP